jgi:hypothetical protein
VEILDALGIDIGDIDPKDLEALIKLIENWFKSGLDLSSASVLLSLLILLAITAYLVDGNRKVLEMDLVVIRIKIGNSYYKGIVDLNDPTGHRLKTLYGLNGNIRGIFVYCPELSFSRIYCVYSTNPIMGTDNIRQVCSILAYDDQFEDYHISCTFPAPNRIL